MIPALFLFWLAMAMRNRQSADGSASQDDKSLTAAQDPSGLLPSTVTVRAPSKPGSSLAMAPIRAQGPIIRTVDGENVIKPDPGDTTGSSGGGSGVVTPPDVDDADEFVPVPSRGIVCFPEMCQPRWGVGVDWFGRYGMPWMRKQCCKGRAVDET